MCAGGALGLPGRDLDRLEWGSKGAIGGFSDFCWLDVGPLYIIYVFLLGFLYR